MKKLLAILGLMICLGGLNQAQAQTNNAYGDNQIEVETGVFAIYSGDMNQDGFIDIFDQIQLDNNLFDGISGYYPSDLNGDGFIDIFDQIVLDNNLFLGVGTISPALGLRQTGSSQSASSANKNN
jgi:hypothetical protein